MTGRIRWGTPVYTAILAAGIGGCGAGRAPAFQSDRLLADELSGAYESSVYEAVKRLRPAFLQSRGVTSLMLPSSGPAVWVDGTLMGGVEWLQWVLPREVVSIRRLNGWDAATAYGPGFSDGVLVVTTRPGPKPSGLPE